LPVTADLGTGWDRDRIDGALALEKRKPAFAGRPVLALTQGREEAPQKKRCPGNLKKAQLGEADKIVLVTCD
jgi:hypothetical protein